MLKGYINDLFRSRSLFSKHQGFQPDSHTGFISLSRAARSSHRHDQMMAPSTLYDKLCINQQLGGARVTIDRLDSSGQLVPIWALHNSPDEKSLAILHADPRLQDPNAALGSAKLHSLSSKIDITVRGEALKMKSNTMGTKHSFTYHGNELSWGVDSSTLSSSTLYLKDSSKRVLAIYQRRPGGMFKQSQPTFDIYVPPATMDMDMLVVTGLAEAKYRSKEKKDSIEAMGEILSA
ncbi:hypothetical protein D7B24_004263 [Verticillium nonalfalfae]|uniref:Uncharacterized protein n=1 Tax=Verticillium nonalfalfae TaxID=1051616 RepID=A0A3M9XYI6_9PEZI|nr:uncharacterized protein D7B24_004263 [Verticillium nonalfalfae]RNJ52138.1 hypothetical protein D7B24_004263 [Verticillium nonalfalfae]